MAHFYQETKKHIITTQIVSIIHSIDNLNLIQYLVKHRIQRVLLKISIAYNSFEVKLNFFKIIIMLHWINICFSKESFIYNLLNFSN